MEQWKDIPGYVGFYQVSDQGNVRSLIRLLPSAVEAGIRREKKVLAFGSNKQGRLQVVLCREGFTKRFQVHTLVLLAFVGPCPEGMECRHLNGKHQDNRRENLEWNTHLVNLGDMVVHGTSFAGVKHPKAKLTEDDIREIRAANATERALGEVYGVSQVTINSIRTRKTWKHVP
jgi:hypothetical protein